MYELIIIICVYYGAGDILRDDCQATLYQRNPIGRHSQCINLGNSITREINGIDDVSVTAVFKCEEEET